MVVIKFVSGMPLGIAVAAFHEVTPNKLRAQATALYMFSINLLGLGLGLGLAIYALKHDKKYELLSAIEASTSA
jgi:hypothetical protein